MKLTAALLVFLVSLTAQAGSGLLGEWTHRSSSNVQSFRFYADGTYTRAATQAGRYEVEAEIETGRYAIVNHVIVTTPEHGTCGRGSEELPYRLENGGLVLLLDGSRVVTYRQRHEAGAGAADSIVTGCFTTTGGFVPAPLR